MKKINYLIALLLLVNLGFSIHSNEKLKKPGLDNCATVNQINDLTLSIDKLSKKLLELDSISSELAEIRYEISQVSIDTSDIGFVKGELQEINRQLLYKSISNR